MFKLAQQRPFLFWLLALIVTGTIVRVITVLATKGKSETPTPNTPKNNYPVNPGPVRPAGII